MPRAEKRVIECFVSTTDVQILQNALDLVHTAGKTERSELSVYVHVRCLTRAPNNFTVVYGNISHLRKQCIPGPLPSFGRGLGMIEQDILRGTCKWLQSTFMYSGWITNSCRSVKAVVAVEVS